MLLGVALAFAQEPTTSRVYCELVGSPDVFTSKMSVFIDFGQKHSYWVSKWGQQLVDENGKDCKFNSMVDAMNFMGKYGWKFVQAYAVGDKNSGYVQYWLLYKDIIEDDEIFEGFMTKEQYKKHSAELRSSGVIANYTITYLESKDGGHEWDFLKEEYIKDVTADELTAKMNEWKAKSSGSHLYDCKAKKEK